MSVNHRSLESLQQELSSVYATNSKLTDTQSDLLESLMNENRAMKKQLEETELDLLREMEAKATLKKSFRKCQKNLNFAMVTIRDLKQQNTEMESWILDHNDSQVTAESELQEDTDNISELHRYRTLSPIPEENPEDISDDELNTADSHYSLVSTHSNPPLVLEQETIASRLSVSTPDLSTTKRRKHRKRQTVEHAQENLKASTQSNLKKKKKQKFTKMFDLAHF